MEKIIEGSLKNQVALVTGGATGIGKGIAQALTAQGAHVVLCSRNEVQLWRHICDDLFTPLAQNVKMQCVSFVQVDLAETPLLLAFCAS